MTRFDSFLSSHTEFVSFSDRTAGAPPSTPNAATPMGTTLCQEWLALSCDLARPGNTHATEPELFHSHVLSLMSSNTCLCQHRCPVTLRLYPPTGLDNAGLPICLDLNIFVRNQESKHFLHAVHICLRTHFCRGQVAVIFANHHETCRFRSWCIHECPLCDNEHEIHLSSGNVTVLRLWRFPVMEVTLSFRRHTHLAPALTC